MIMYPYLQYSQKFLIAQRKFHFFFTPLLSWVKFLSCEHLILFHVNHYIEPMAIITAWVKFYSINACNARVAALNKSFVQRNISESAVWYRATIFLSITACCRISPSQNACVVCRGESASMELIGLWMNVRSGRWKA